MVTTDFGTQVIFKYATLYHCSKDLRLFGFTNLCDHREKLLSLSHHSSLINELDVERS